MKLSPALLAAFTALVLIAAGAPVPSTLSLGAKLRTDPESARTGAELDARTGSGEGFIDLFKSAGGLGDVAQHDRLKIAEGLEDVLPHDPPIVFNKQPRIDGDGKVMPTQESFTVVQNPTEHYKYWMQIHQPYWNLVAAQALKRKRKNVSQLNKAAKGWRASKRLRD